MGPLLVLMFLIAPVIEIYVIIVVGQQIGVIPTVLLLLFESAIGAWLVKREGARAWKALTGALASARMPNVELADAALVLVGGTLLLTPGFVTDIFGFFLILPFTRPVARRGLARFLARRRRRRNTATRRSGAPQAFRRPGERVVSGEVIADPEDPRG